MATCQAITSAGRPCPCKARDGFNTCGRHKNVDILIDLTLCGQEKVNGTRCAKQCADGDTMCNLHRTIADRREQTRRGRIVWIETLDVLWGQVVMTDYAEVRAIADAALDTDWITQFTYDNLLIDIRNEWLWYQRERLFPTAKATTDLQRLALDNQNVHTKEVNQLTSDSTKFLLETPVPADQETVAELETAWADKNSAHRKKVLRDVKEWYEMKSCVKQSDWLYKRMLDGLWVRVKTHKEQKELTQRLWEEAFESVSKCCQGHLSRLANVLVGFIEEVKAEVPMGEILQQKIALIAAKDIGVEFKVCEAWDVFEELKVPMEERDAWIEAF